MEKVGVLTQEQMRAIEEKIRTLKIPLSSEAGGLIMATEGERLLKAMRKVLSITKPAAGEEPSEGVRSLEEIARGTERAIEICKDKNSSENARFKAANWIYRLREAVYNTTFEEVDSEGHTISEVPTPKGKKETPYIKLSEQKPEGKGMGEVALEIMNEISNYPSSTTRLPKDFAKALTVSGGEVRNLIKDEAKVGEIERDNESNELINGTKIGLMGLDGYTISLIIALAETLNEQDRYFRTGNKLIGAKEWLREKYGDTMAISGSVELNGENREYPYIIVLYEALAAKMRGAGKTRGGKDAKIVRDKIKKLQDKFYIIPDGVAPNGDKLVREVRYINIPENIAIHKKSGKRVEIGCIIRLSPQLSQAGEVAYKSIGGGIIQAIGGAQQSAITWNLILKLIWARGIGKVLSKNKGVLLDELATGSYSELSKAKKEKLLKEALGKAKMAGIITGYKFRGEGEKECIDFYFNMNYIKAAEEENETGTKSPKNGGLHPKNGGLHPEAQK